MKVKITDGLQVIEVTMSAIDQAPEVTMCDSDQAADAEARSWDTSKGRCLGGETGVSDSAPEAEETADEEMCWVTRLRLNVEAREAELASIAKSRGAMNLTSDNFSAV